MLEARENAELFRELKLCPYLAKYYQKNIDLFCFFSCISVDLLANNGIHSYIVPIYWKDRTGADKMRRKFFQEGRLELLVDFDGFPVFVDAPGHHSSIYVFTKSAEKASPQGYLEVEVDSTLNRESQEKTIVHQLKTRNAQPVFFRLSGGKLVTNLLGQEDLIEVFESLPHFHLEETKVVRGVDTSPSDYQGKGVFVLSDTEFNSISHMLDLREREFFKPFYSASQVDAYYFEPQSNQWLLYTDRNRRQKLENCPADYPHLISHLKQFAKIITSDNKPYGLHRAKEEENFLNESKILFVRKTAYPKFAYCELPFFCDESIYIILPNKDTSQFYLLTILNSPIFSWWCSHHKTQGSQLQIDKEIVLGMPIRRISFNTPQKERAHLLEEAKGLYKEYLENQDWSKVITFVIGRLPHKADDTPDMEHEQSDVVHDLLAFLAEEMTRLHKEEQSKIKGFLAWLEKEILKGSVQDQKNKTRMKDFCNNTFEDLLDTLKKNKVVSDPYPSDKRNILENEFNGALTVINPLRNKIKFTDELIDRMVYKLYGLTDEEIAVVEGRS